MASGFIRPSKKMRLKALKGHWRGKSFVCEWMERSYVDRSCKPCFWSGDRFSVFTSLLGKDLWGSFR